MCENTFLFLSENADSFLLYSFQSFYYKRCPVLAERPTNACVFNYLADLLNVIV
jgi:hypothetical protein